MTTAQAKRTVLVAMLALLVIGQYRAVRQDDGLRFKRAWSAGVLGLFLSLLADFAPQVAGPFAALTVLGALTHGGDRAIVNLFGAPKTASSSPAAGPPSSSSPAPAAGASRGHTPTTIVTSH